MKKVRKKKTTEQRQEQILKAAMEVFSRKGYSAATIPEIAKGAEVAAGTIYLYYPSKRELFIAVIKNFIITTPLLDLLGRLPRGNPAVILKNIWQDRLELVKSSMISRMPSLMGEIVRDQEIRELWLEQFLRPFFSRIETVFRLMTAAGKVRKIEPAVAVRAMGGIFIGFLILRIMEGESSPLTKLPQSKVADDLANFVMHGLVAENAKETAR